MYTQFYYNRQSHGLRASLKSVYARNTVSTFIYICQNVEEGLWRYKGLDEVAQVTPTHSGLVASHEEIDSR